MNRYPRTLRGGGASALLAAGLLLSGCSIYDNDVSNVTCNGEQTRVGLTGTSEVIFTVHDDAHPAHYALVAVMRHDGQMAVDSQPVRSKNADTLRPFNFSEKQPIGTGTDVVVHEGDGLWTVHVNPESVVISGTCM